MAAVTHARDWRFWFCGLVVLLGLAMVLAGPADWLAPHQWAAAALTLGAIAFWGTGALPEPVTAFLFMALAVIGVAPPEVTFSGFLSPAFWLVFAGMIFGIAVDRTGLGARIALRLATLFGTRYAALVFGVVLSAGLLAFPMPSAMGRAVLVIPIVAALAKASGYPEGSRGYEGLILAGAFGTFIAGFAVMPANLINLVLVGAAERVLDHHFLYGEWLWRFFPVMGLLRVAMVAGLVLLLYGDPPREGSDRPPLRGPARPAEWRLGLILLLAIIGWMTDTAHGLSPAWIAMLAGGICVLPWIGVMDGKDMSSLGLGPLLYVVGILGLGAVVAESGLGARVAEGLLSIGDLGALGAVGSFVAVTATALVVALGTTLPGAAAVMVPLSAQIADAAGLALDTVLTAIMLGCATPLLPYQAAPMVVALQLGAVPLAVGTRFTLLIAAGTILFLLPLEILWLMIVGLL